jgi:hypothetical protein
MDANRYGWTGWHDGADIEPPEPNKEWLAIEEYGEEFAVIVLRTNASRFVESPEDLVLARLDRQMRADTIVNALNAYNGGAP